MLEDSTTHTYSNRLERVCLKNSYSQPEIQRFFNPKETHPILAKFDLQELPISTTMCESYKRLLMLLKKYNENVDKQHRKLTFAENAAYQYVFSAIRNLGFESGEAQRKNFQALEDWFGRTMQIRKRQPLQHQIERTSIQDDEPTSNAQAARRINDYSRRLLDAHTGIIRQKRVEQEDTSSEEFKMARVNNRLLMTQLKDYRERREHNEIIRTILQAKNNKNRLKGNILFQKEYLENGDDMEGVIQKQSASNEDDGIDQIDLTTKTDAFIVSTLGKIKNHQPSVSGKFKFTQLSPAETAHTRNRSMITKSRTNTADPQRFMREILKQERIRKRVDKSERLEETTTIKSRIHVSKMAVSHQLLFRGLNEPQFLQTTPMNLTDSGFKLMTLPPTNDKKKKKRSSQVHQLL